MSQLQWYIPGDKLSTEPSHPRQVIPVEHDTNGKLEELGIKDDGSPVYFIDDNGWYTAVQVSPSFTSKSS